jgi:hypothetical protein
MDMSPRLLQQKIHSTFATNEATWESFRTEITNLYDNVTNKADFNNHLIREFNRKIINLGLSQNLMFSPFDSGFRFLGNTLGELAITGFAYPNETLTAPSGSSYLWTVDEENRGTSRTFIPTVYDIGKTVSCLVGGASTYLTTIWHPSDIPAVKNFWWAASGAYNSIGNGVTDANASITVSLPISTVLSRAIGGDLNGKAAYGTNIGDSGSNWCYWNGSQWLINIYYNGSDNAYTSSDNTTYPWQAVWPNSQTVTRQTTTLDVLATDGQAVGFWRDVISEIDLTASGSNIAFFEATDLTSPSLKFDSTDFFTIPLALRTVFNSQNNCYIFAGAKDTNASGGDSTHGIVSINRTGSLGSGTTTKVALLTRDSNVGNFVARTKSNNATDISAASTSNSNYNVLTNESLFSNGSLRLRVNGNETASSIISTVVPDNTTSNSFIGAYLSNSTTNFNGYMTAIILAADSTPLSDTDRSRIERFIGLLDSGIDIPLV